MTVTSAETGRVRAGASADSLRLSVRAVGGRADVIATASTTPAELLLAFDVDPAQASLALTTGTVLAPHLPLGAQGVRDGELLAVLAPDAPAIPVTRRHKNRAVIPRPTGMPLELALLPGALALAGLAAGLATFAETAARLGVAAGLALAGAIVALAPRRGLLIPGAEALGPIFLAAAAVALIPRDEAGADLLAIVAAGVVAAQAAALLRLRATPAAQPALVVWIWTGAAVAAAGAGVLAGGGSPRVVWALLAIGAVTATRMLPRLAIDVPDEQLIDADKMAATTWSLRGAPTSRRVRIRTPEVEATVLGGRRLLDAAAVVASCVVAAAAVALPVDPFPGWERWLAFATGGLAGVALLLGSRAFAGGLPRLALRLGGLFAVAAGAGGALAAASDVGRLGIAAGCFALALPVAFAAAALGRGWRTVWWARLGDAVESLVVALVFPAALIAAGTFGHFRQMLS